LRLEAQGRGTARRRLLKPVVNAAAQASLIVAEAQLSLIRDLRTAMKKANAAVAEQNQSLPVVVTARRQPDRIEPHQNYRPSARIEKDRAVYHRPRHVHVPRLAQLPPPLPPTASCCCCPDTHPVHQPLTIQPPWEVLPWPKHLETREHFKPVAPPPDILVKGLLIDIFV
jgi:hypothetical protein